MAIKYTIPMRDDFDLLWRADIDIPGYSGEAIQLTGVGRTAMVSEWNGDIDEPYTPIINSKVTLQFYNEGNVDIVELQNLQDMEARVHVYRDNVLWWTGYVVPDGIQRNFRAFPYPVQLVATDGLALLKDIPFALPNNWPMPVGVSNRCPINFLRYVLYGSNHLNQPLPLRWDSMVESVEYEDDLLFGTTQWGALGEAWQDLNGNQRSCMYILENMVKSVGARFFQFGGKWHLQRINDIAGGTYNWKELTTDTGTAPTLTTGTEDLVAGLNSVYYPFISEDHVITNKPALTDVVATYEHYQAENIIPNGSFELWSMGALLYWGFTPGIGSGGYYEQHADITGRTGTEERPRYAVALDKVGASDDAEFTYAGGLPIDANILFKRFTFGFTFMAVRFPSDSEGLIDWSINPLKISVMYTLPIDGGTRDYYLNEFGYWQYMSRGTDIGVQYINTESTLISPPGNVWIHSVIFEGSPNVGDVLQVGIRNNPGGGYQWYSFTVSLVEEGNLNLALDGLLAAITNSRIASKQVVMDSSTRGKIRFQDLINYAYPSGNTYKSGATQEYQYIFPRIDQLKLNDIASVVFQGKGGNTEILMPDPGLLDGTQDPSVGKLHIKFYIKDGQRYVLDDVYVRVDDNNDVYQSINTASNKRSNRHNVELGISTSFSGFMLSNYMTSYNKSNVDFVVTDGKHTSSLTGLLANSMMRFRYKPSQIFNGTVYTNGRDWNFHHMYLISAISNNLFLPMQSKYNIETCQVTLAVIEARDDNETFEEKHYASNDVILSN